MPGILILGFLLSGFVFLGCLGTAFGRKKGADFLGCAFLTLILLTLILLCGGLLVVLVRFRGTLGYETLGVLVWGIIIGPYLPGFASIVSLIYTSDPKRHKLLSVELKRDALHETEKPSPGEPETFVSGWMCLNCDESNPAEFASCWNCGESRKH